MLFEASIICAYCQGVYKLLIFQFTDLFLYSAHPHIFPELA